jgi:D-3-phosphoglycerate dehydrogenase/(S)-sulfolactate dehydrogenase
MPVALITPELMRHKPAPYVDILRAGGFEVRYSKDPFFTRGLGSEQQTIDEYRGVSAAIAGGEHITPGVLAALPELRVVARAGVGFDRVDVPACTRHGVVVTITPTANHEAVAEHALALIFAFAKRIVVGDKATRAGQWPRDLLRPIRGQTLGLLGLGRIGRSTAVRAKLLGMNVIATEKYPNESFVRANAIELVDFDTLLARSDYLSVHCPLNDETRGLLNRQAFAKMKPGSVLVNTSRGGTVVEADLVAALRSGHLGGAALDVFEQEPPARDNPLFAIDNVVLSPHIAGTDTRSMEDMGIECAQCIVKLHRGEWPEGAVVNEELRGRWRW